MLENENISESSSECEPCSLGLACPKELNNINSKNDIEKSELYKILSQFSEMNINVLTSNHAFELLKAIKDPKLRMQIIDEINTESSTSTSYNTEEDLNGTIINPKRSYNMNEVMNQLRSKYQYKEDNISLQNLYKEINNLKEEIKILKDKNTIQESRISDLENISRLESRSQNDNKLKIDEHSIFSENFLSTIEMVISQKWYIKISLLIDNHYTKSFTALVDSGADLNVIQEGLIPTRYFHKTSHTLWHAGGDKLQIQYKIPKAFVCIDNKCISQSFILAKNITNQVILGTPFLHNIYSIKRIDSKGIIRTFQNDDIFLEFIVEPFSKMLHNIYDNIKAKQNQINFLKQEINIITIEEQLKNPKLQDKISLLKNQFSLEICNDILMLFGIERNK